MPCSDEFWKAFWPTLGTVLGFLPVLVVMAAAWGLWLWWMLRPSPRERRLGERVAYLEARVLPFEEARRQREGG
jgi:hypothetical protein